MMNAMRGSNNHRLQHFKVFFTRPRGIASFTGTMIMVSPTSA